MRARYDCQGLGLDVLPVEARAYIKQPMVSPDQTLLDYYSLLYASYQKSLPVQLSLYRTAAFDGVVVPQVDLHADAVDRSLWIALLGRTGDRGSDPTDPWRAARGELGGRTLTLGVVPVLSAVRAELRPGNAAPSEEERVSAPPVIHPLPWSATVGTIIVRVRRRLGDARRLRLWQKNRRGAAG